MARFQTRVKLYVLDKRAEGVGWKAIGQGIKEKFDIDPPTVRAMQKWEKKLDRRALSGELMKEIKGQMPSIEADVQMQVVQGLIPVLWKAKDAGLDVDLEGWKWFLHLIESQIGSSKFEFVIKEYMAEREKAK